MTKIISVGTKNKLVCHVISPENVKTINQLAFSHNVNIAHEYSRCPISKIVRACSTLKENKRVKTIN